MLEQTGVRLVLGTLYGALTKMVDLGLIAPLPSDDRRRPYTLTTAGRAALAARLDTCSRVVDAGRTRLAPA